MFPLLAALALYPATLSFGDAPRGGEAAEVNFATPFALESHVSDEQLAASAAMPGFSLTTEGFSRAAEWHARQDFRASGEISRVEMDVWWGSTGAEMIATSVRNAAGGP